MLALNMRFRLLTLFLFLNSIICFYFLVESRCTRGCDLALGSYYVGNGMNLTSIFPYMKTDINRILMYNRDTIPNQNTLPAFVRINVPFSCDCINGEFLGHVFSYTIKSQDTYELIADERYANLTTAGWIQRFNSYDPNRIHVNADVNITVNCSCGDSLISKDYGLFVTYPLREGDTLDSVSSTANLSSELIRRYNPDADFSIVNSLIYIPGRDETGTYPPLTNRAGGSMRLDKDVLKPQGCWTPALISYENQNNAPLTTTSSGLSGGAIGGIVVAVVAGVLLLAGCLYYGFYRKKNSKKSSDVLKNAQIQGPNGTSLGGSDPHGLPVIAPPVLTGITVNKSVEFSYKELSIATDKFSLANKIGQGGFGAVYYAELRDKKAAIKKMNMQASREFLAELKVLTQVHHLNLGSLFLVYEYIENGNLSQHLHEIERDPLPWSTRVQIALDSARGLEYIHEHTVPVYIHRDIKSANILIDKNFHAKVADFGLAKLVQVGNTSLPTRLVGTFGYMPPEYARCADVSPKVDVYAFGVVLYELISAKEAIVKTEGSYAKGLVALFDDVLSQVDPKDDLVKMIDPRLGDNYLLDSVCKVAQLAKACTHEDPHLRPSMRSIVVELMTLSSSIEDKDFGSFYENQTLVSLMSDNEWP